MVRLRLAPLPTGTSTGALQSVSCGAKGICTATGYATVGSSDQEATADAITPTGMTTQVLPVPSGQQMQGTRPVACAKVGNCVTAGASFESSNSTEHLVLEVQSGGTWSDKVDLVPSSTWCFDTDPCGGGAIPACQAWSGTCYEFGSFWTKSGSQWMVDTVHGGAVTSNAIPELSGDSPGDSTYASCPSTGNCTQVGRSQLEGPNNNGTPLLVSGSANTWVTQAGGPGYGITALSCATAGGCVAAMNTWGTDQIDVQSGASWKLETVPAPATDPTLQSHIDYLSCPIAGWCAAAGIFTGNGNTSGTLLAARENGTWMPAVAPLPAGASNAGVDALDCVTKNSCAAVGSYTTPTSVVGPLFYVLKLGLTVRIGPPSN